MAADEWLALKSFSLATSSLRIERDNLKHILPHFERRLVTDIKGMDVSRYQRARLGEYASPKTVNLETGTLRAILRRYKVWADIQPDIRMLPTIDDVGHALTVEEEEALISACLQSRSRCLYPAVMLSLNTGMRYSEIRLLQYKQVDFAGRTLAVGRSKTLSGTGRIIPLNAKILNVIEMWASQFPHRQPDHFVFPSEKCGGKGQEDRFGFTGGVTFYQTDPTHPIGDRKEAWEKARERAAAILRVDKESPEKQGLKEPTASRSKKNLQPSAQDVKLASLKCRFHDLRHTAVTRLLEAGIPYPVVASMMGWSAATAIRMAKRYGHIGTQALRDAADVLGRTKILVGSLKKSPNSPEVSNVSVQ